MSSTLLNLDDMTTTTCVRNTFIDVHQQPSSATRRNKSLPPSFRSSCASHGTLEPCEKINPTTAFTAKSDDSTDVRTEASSDDTPSLEACTIPSDMCSGSYSLQNHCEPCVLPAYACQVPSQATLGACGVPLAWTPMEQPGEFYQSEVASVQSNTRLSSKAIIFQPSQQFSQQLSKVNVDGHSQVVEMVDAAKTILEQSQDVGGVDLTQGLHGWTIAIVPGKNIQGRRAQEQLLALAKDALLEGAEQSKSVYVLGYGYDETAFTMQPQGFTAQLAVAENTQSVCWPMLKQGSCRYGANCGKEHPDLQVPVHVFLETACFTGPRQTIQYYKREIASFMMIVTAILTRSASVEEAAAFTEQAGDGWRIEMSIRAEDLNHKESFLTLAKNAFMEAAQRSNVVRVMGTGATPFISKSSGFVTMLGEMADRSQACWDVYMQGCCWREALCRWQHPQCLMPVNVVLKPMVQPSTPRVEEVA